MKTNILLLSGGLLLAALALWTACDSQPRPSTAKAPPTIEPAGEILGLTIGSGMEEARAKLDPFRVPAVYTPDGKEKSGRRIYWKLRETEFDWIMAWASAEGKITRLRGVYRAGQEKPFQEIGDLAQAASVSSEAVKWNLRRPQGPYYRLIAQGAEQKAKTVYMFSLGMPGEGSDAARPEEGDDD